jgi:hypothetical protein
VSRLILKSQQVLSCLVKGCFDSGRHDISEVG